jgi:hypothetical protein
LKINDACLESIEYHSDRKLIKNLLFASSTCSYKWKLRDVLIIGAAGNTYIACALGKAVCLKYISVKYKLSRTSHGPVDSADGTEPLKNHYTRKVSPYLKKLLI